MTSSSNLRPSASSADKQPSTAGANRLTHIIPDPPPTQPLSPDAMAVLSCLLRADALCPEHSITHEQIADVCDLPARCIVECTYELLTHGYLISTNHDPPPHGVFLTLPGADLSAARRDQKQLHERAGKIHRRADLMRKVIENYECAPAGRQGVLFTQATNTSPKGGAFV